MIGEQTELNVLHQRGDEMDADERLIGDAMIGHTTLFVRQDSAEAQWRIVDPILGGERPVHVYEAGSWGPEAADALVGSWRTPHTH